MLEERYYIITAPFRCLPCEGLKAVVHYFNLPCTFLDFESEEAQTIIKETNSKGFPVVYDAQTEVSPTFWPDFIKEEFDLDSEEFSSTYYRGVMGAYSKEEE